MSEDNSRVVAVNQFWRCPHCGAATGGGETGLMHPPRCSCKGGTEMEQTTAEGFMWPYDADTEEEQA